MLKTMKKTLPLSMRPIQSNKYLNQSANTEWNLDTTHKFIKYKLIVSGIIDGHNQKNLWLKCSINNKSETAYDLFLKDARDNVNPFQVRGDMGVENRLLSKHMMSLRNSAHNGFIGAIHINTLK